jgi:hypothetical protein
MWLFWDAKKVHFFNTWQYLERPYNHMDMTKSSQTFDCSGVRRVMIMTSMQLEIMVMVMIMDLCKTEE